MKFLNRLTLSIIILAAGGAGVAAADSYTITEGSVTVTPARCINNECQPQKGVLQGVVTTKIENEGSEILFPYATIKTDPDLEFKLPSDPSEDHNGTQMDVAFSVLGNELTVSGTVDNRAFDGPLIEYSFVAVLQSGDFYTARRDLRKCASPQCGGYFIKSVNNKRTQCADGKMMPECYVEGIRYKNGTDFNEEAGYSLKNRTPLLLQGNIEGIMSIDFRGGSVFLAESAYRGVTDKSTSKRFFEIENNGIVCITEPCFSYEEANLNHPDRTSALSDLQFDRSGASEEDIALATELLTNGAPLYVSGHNKLYKGTAGTGVRMVVDQIYLPLE